MCDAKVNDLYLYLNYLWHSLTFNHHFIANLDSWVTQGLEHFSRIQAHKVSDLITLC